MYQMFCPQSPCTSNNDIAGGYQTLCLNDSIDLVLYSLATEVYDLGPHSLFQLTELISGVNNRIRVFLYKVTLDDLYRYRRVYRAHKTDFSQDGGL